MAFLDTLLTSEVEGKPLTFEEIFEEVSTFMFEVRAKLFSLAVYWCVPYLLQGHDTTSSAITFGIFCLASTPEVQLRAYEEQRQIYGDDKVRHPTYQELQDMKYLDLVIKETLRLFPSVPYIFRTTLEPAVIREFRKAFNI